MEKKQQCTVMLAKAVLSYMLIKTGDSNIVYTPWRVSQVFEVSGDRNQICLDLQIHLSIQVGLDYLIPTQTHLLQFTSDKM